MSRTDEAAGWQTAAAAASGAFAWGCLLTQVVTVPVWRRAPTSQDGLEAFRRTGPATGAVLFPIDVLATGLLIEVAVSRAQHQQPGASPALAAALHGPDALAVDDVADAQGRVVLLQEAGDLPAALAADHDVDRSAGAVVATLALQATTAGYVARRLGLLEEPPGEA